MRPELLTEPTAGVLLGFLATIVVVLLACGAASKLYAFWVLRKNAGHRRFTIHQMQNRLDQMESKKCITLTKF